VAELLRCLARRCGASFQNVLQDFPSLCWVTNLGRPQPVAIELQAEPEPFVLPIEEVDRAKDGITCVQIFGPIAAFRFAY